MRWMKRLALGCMLGWMLSGSAGAGEMTAGMQIRNAGRYTVVWNGKDALGRQVASGIYFYRLEGQGFKQTRRMLLLK